MARADHIGRGILINETVGLGVGKESAVFQAGKGARSVHICCHVTAGGAVTATLLIEVEDPTTEKESTFTGLEQVTFSAANPIPDQVDKDTIKKYNFEGGAGSRVRCTVTPSAAATVKVWAWSSY